MGKFIIRSGGRFRSRDLVVPIGEKTNFHGRGIRDLHLFLGNFQSSLLSV